MSFFEVRVSYNIVFTTAIPLTHAIGHVTLRPVLRAEWSDQISGQTRSDNRKRRIMDASIKPMISVKLSTLELFY